MSLLAKQCWRIIHFPNSLASRVLKGCYFPNFNLIKMPKKFVGSFVWHHLDWGKGILELGIRKWVGNGASIRIYKDNWVPGSTSFRVCSPPSLGLDATVDYLLTDSSGWNLQKLNSNFSIDEIDRILQIPIGFGPADDTNIWNFEGTGIYSVKSGYWVSRNLIPSPSPSPFASSDQQ